MSRKHIVQNKWKTIISGFISGFFVYFALCYSLNHTLTPERPVAAAEPGAAMEQLQQAAYKEGKLMWYESSPEGQFAKVEAAFNKRYPKIKLEHVRLRGADVGTRIIAESQADAPTADVANSGLDILIRLDERKLLARESWADLGIAENLIAVPYALRSMAVTYCINYNTNLVSEADAPKKWEDVLNPKWNGKIGIWQKPAALALLTPAWGEEKILDYTKKLAELKPVIYRSNYPLNNALAAGEISVGITIYHTAIPTKKKGAPTQLVFASPTPYEPLCSAITSKAAHPNAAKLFIAWFHSLEGARAYENATNRGNPWISGTETYKLLQGKKLSTFTPEQSQYFGIISKKIEKILMNR